MIRDTLIIRLADDDNRLDLLGQYDQEMILDHTIRFIKAKESGKSSVGRLNHLQSSNDASINTVSL